MTSDVRYEIKTSLPVIWLETLTEKSGSVRLNEHEHNKLILVLRERLDRFLRKVWQILVDPVDDEDVEELRVLRLLFLQLTMRSKEMEEY
jgi:hypothetical protein